MSEQRGQDLQGCNCRRLNSALKYARESSEPSLQLSPPLSSVKSAERDPDVWLQKKTRTDDHVGPFWLSFEKAEAPWAGTTGLLKKMKLFLSFSDFW